MASNVFPATNTRAQPAAYDFPSRNPASLYIPPEQYSSVTFLRPNDYYGLPSQTVQYLATPSGQVLKPKPVPRNTRGSGFGYKDGEPFVRYEMPSSIDIYNPQSTPRLPPGQDVTIQSYRSTFGDSVIPKYKPLSIVDSLNAELQSTWSPQDIQPVVAMRQSPVMNGSNRKAPNARQGGAFLSGVTRQQRPKGFISGVTRQGGSFEVGSRYATDPTMSKAPMKHDYMTTCGGSMLVDPVNRESSRRKTCSKTLVPTVRSGGDFLPPSYHMGGDFLPPMSIGGDFLPPSYHRRGGDFLPPSYHRGGDFLPPNYRRGRGMKKASGKKSSKKGKSKKSRRGTKSGGGNKGVGSAGQFNPFKGMNKIILP